MQMKIQEESKLKKSIALSIAAFLTRTDMTVLSNGGRNGTDKLEAYDE
jgi:hypothetical protein